MASSDPVSTTDATKSKKWSRMMASRALEVECSTLFHMFSRMFKLSWKIFAFNNYRSEDSRDSGSRKIEFSLKNTTFLD